MALFVLKYDYSQYSFLEDMSLVSRLIFCELKKQKPTYILFSFYTGESGEGARKVCKTESR